MLLLLKIAERSDQQRKVLILIDGLLWARYFIHSSFTHSFTSFRSYSFIEYVLNTFQVAGIMLGARVQHLAQSRETL